MTDAPPTPALALVVEALRSVVWAATHQGVSQELYEHHARALLQKLDALSGNNDREVCHQEEQKKLAPPDAIRAARDGTVAHFEGNGPSVTGVIWVGTKPEPGTAVYLAPPSGAALPHVSEVGCIVFAGRCHRENCPNHAPSPAQGWRPIESAPWDIAILGYWENHEQHVGQIDERGWNDTFADGSRWMMPTHWQPLPAPPPHGDKP